MLKKINWNHLLTGLTIGMLTPFLLLFCYWLFVFNYMSFMPGFFNYLIIGKILSSLISLTMFANVGLFFLFINRNNYKSGKGLILSSIIYGIIILYIKIALEHSFDFDY